MGLADEVNALPRRMTRENVDEFLGPDDAKEFDELLKDKRVPPQAIWKALKARGLPVSNRTIAYWATQARA